MKEVLLLIVGALVVMALMSGGGVRTDVSPTLTFQPKIGYMPDNRVISVDMLQNINTNVEHQTVIINPDNALTSLNTHQAEGRGVTILDLPGQVCTPLPNEVIFNGPDAKGACFVRDQQGNEFFLNAAGSRWPLNSSTHSSTIAQEVDVQSFTLEQLEKAYLDAGGTLPWSWDSQDDNIKREWLLEKLEGN